MKNFILNIIVVSFCHSVFAAIPQTEKLDFLVQIEKAKNQKLPMSQRWQALVEAADSANYAQLVEIKKFANSKEWYMRNATLVALEKINIEHAIEEAQTLVKDKALVVRSAAVDTLAKKLNRETRDLLVEELNKPYNFSKKQSLWIRSKIFDVIASKSASDDRRFFSRYLFDSDEKIVKRTISTLEKITEVHFSQKNQTQEWRDYVKKNGWL